MAKILIVDDKANNLFTLENVLKRLDVDIVKASSGSDALRATLYHEFALAILDVQMPEMDGYELAHLLRQDDRTRHIPIIFLSAVYSDEPNIFRGYESGGVDFITKPFSPEVLLSKVRVFLELNEQKSKLVSQKARLEQVVSELEEQIEERKRAEAELCRAHDELELRVLERTADLELSNKALMEYAVKLERLNEQLQDFTFAASHDLQEPLRKIQTFCDMALKRCAPALDSTAQEYLDRVINSANRMRELLRDLLVFSRVATRPETFKGIDLESIVREAADVFEASVKKAGCKIEVENMPVIEADESQMLRLFQNLIGNALKFRREETPHIRIYGKINGQEICEISVRDNGIGFDQQHAELIFKPFQRLHNRNKYDGTGMGLAICRKILESHGGTISVESEPGKGSTFVIRIPVRQTGPETFDAG